MNRPDRLQGEQMALLPELEIVPTRPKAGTLSARLLAMLEAGEVLTHPEFEARAGSWRLAACVFELQVLGWPVTPIYIPAPTPSCPRRRIARYYLQRKVSQ